jgi:hypothetical protein
MTLSARRTSTRPRSRNLHKSKNGSRQRARNTPKRSKQRTPRRLSRRRSRKPSRKSGSRARKSRKSARKSAGRQRQSCRLQGGVNASYVGAAGVAGFGLGYAASNRKLKEQSQLLHELSQTLKNLKNPEKNLNLAQYNALKNRRDTLYKKLNLYRRDIEDEGAEEENKHDLAVHRVALSSKDPFSSNLDE